MRFWFFGANGWSGKTWAGDFGFSGWRFEK
jgi:hypothetical protein